MDKVLSFSDRLKKTDSDYNGLNCNNPNLVIEPVESAKSGAEAIENVIYAPNIAGFPSSAGAYQLMNDVNPEIAAYVQKNLMAHNRSKDGNPDGDFVLDIQRGSNETPEAYADRVQKILQKSSQVSPEPGKSE